MCSKLHDVCDVKTFETLRFAKLLFGKNLFIPKRFLRENFKILLIVNNSFPLFYSASFLCQSQKRIFRNMKSEKKPQKVTWPYIYLSKEGKTHEILVWSLKKNFANIKCCKVLRTLKSRGL